MITLHTGDLSDWPEEGRGEWKEGAQQAQQRLEKRQGPGGDMAGWLDLGAPLDPASHRRMKELAGRIRRDAQALVVVGIGGSSLGARAALSGLGGDFPVYFAGHHMDGRSFQELLETLQDRRFAVAYISKSGNTLEPALSFRFLRSLLEKQHGKQWSEFVVAVTDASKGRLRAMAARWGMETLEVPRDVGGRYSVLSSVGLFPLLCAGVDIQAFRQGAAECRKACRRKDSDALRYAAWRTYLYRQGKSVELLVTYDPAMAMLAEWWKQLFGESEGKQGQGLFPASAQFPADLHSLGQFVQEGTPLLFETVLWVETALRDRTVPVWLEGDDGLDPLEGRSLSWILRMTCEGTRRAHGDARVPNLELRVPAIDAAGLGALFFFFQYACAVSAGMLGVNPFDQPGVEAYKKNVKKLLYPS